MYLANCNRQSHHRNEAAVGQWLQMRFATMKLQLHTESSQVCNPIRPTAQHHPPKPNPQQPRFALPHVLVTITLHCLMKPFPPLPSVPFNPWLAFSQSLSLANRPTGTDVNKTSLIKSSRQCNVMNAKGSLLGACHKINERHSSSQA
jgi:hypothetical protein